MMKSFFIKILTRLFPDAYIQRTFHKFQKTFYNNLVDQEFEVLPYLVNKQSIVLDIGANMGEYCYFFYVTKTFRCPHNLVSKLSEFFFKVLRHLAVACNQITVATNLNI